MNDDQIAASVCEHTPELDPKDVIEFMREHAKPTASPVLHRMGGALASPARLKRARGRTLEEARLRGRHA